jgi:cysteine-rich repeat protein
MRPTFVLAALVLGAGPVQAWYHRLDPSPLQCSRAASVTADAAGDVYAAGQVFDCALWEGAAPVVVKLRGSDGAEQWRLESLAGVSGECVTWLGVASDPAGGIGLSGASNPCFDDDLPDEGFAARIASDGRLLWLTNLGDGSRVSGAVAGALHVVMAGGTLFGLAGATGAVTWAQPLEGPGSEMRISATGRAVVVIPDGRDLRVTAYMAQTGAPQWSAVVTGTPGYGQRLLHFGSDFGVEFVVVTAGSTASMLDIQNGSLFWSRTLPADAIVGAVFGSEHRLFLGTFFRGATLDPSNLLLVHTTIAGFDELRTQLAGGASEPSTWRMLGDGAGDLVFAGSGVGHLIKAAADDLSERWDWTVTGDAEAGPAWFDVETIGTDAKDNLLLAGETTETTDHDDVQVGGGIFSVMKRTAATGASFPCGDGVVEGGEACDDGNTVDGDGCDATCRPSGCGSGRVSGSEECDDGNVIGGDGCSAECRREPQCGALDVRGRWSAQLSCGLRDAFGLGQFPIYVTATFPLDVGQDCATEALRASLPSACGQLTLGGVDRSLGCGAEGTVLQGQLAADGTGLVLDDLDVRFGFDTVAVGGCGLTTMRAVGSLVLQAEVVRPGHARRLVGEFGPELTFENDAGTTCLQKAPDLTCFVRMERDGLVPSSCLLGCDDEDPCTIDDCDTFGWCRHAPVIAGTTGAVCQLRRDFDVGDACAADEDRGAAPRLLGRLDPTGLDGASARELRRELRVLRHVKARIRDLTDRRVLSRRCGRIVLKDLRALRRALRDDRRSRRSQQAT